jgi:hypothetical protein
LGKSLGWSTTMTQPVMIEFLSQGRRGRLDCRGGGRARRAACHED